MNVMDSWVERLSEGRIRRPEPGEKATAAGVVGWRSEGGATSQLVGSFVFVFVF